MEKLYKVGDCVWYASFGSEEVRVPCPVCYGNKKVLVILGNGDEVEVVCDYCSRGFEGAKGYVTEYQHTAKAEYMTITRRKIEEVFGEEKIEYTSAHFLLTPERMFDTEQEALDCAAEMAEKYAQEQAEKPKYKNEKSYTWNAGYHLRQAQSKYKEAQYHEAKAKVCKSRSKD